MATSEQQDSNWSLHTATGDYSSERKRILYIETYGSGSHERIARLVQEHSCHSIDLVMLDRGHWRWLALASHRSALDAISSGAINLPDALIVSGPIEIAKLVGGLPQSWRSVPRAVYFHESQWTYPGSDFDPRPYLVSHLEAIEHCDRVWFNSRFHRDQFRLRALTSQSRTERSLARELVPIHWNKTRVVYPPVQITSGADAGDDRFHVVWAARWESDKRPDLLVAAILKCAHAGVDICLHVLGTPHERLDADSTFRALRLLIAKPYGHLSRAEYESTLAGADVWLSTADHEFFGVAAIEAAMSGATPLVPSGLAYDETLPSAVFYPQRDTDALAARLKHLSQRQFGRLRPWSIDAQRFDVRAAIQHFDAHCDELIGV